MQLCPPSISTPCHTPPHTHFHDVAGEEDLVKAVRPLEVRERRLKPSMVGVLTLHQQVVSRPPPVVAPVATPPVQGTVRYSLQLHLWTFPHWDTQEDDLCPPPAAGQEEMIKN